MQIFEGLQHQTPATGKAQRVVFAGPDKGLHGATAVFVRLPPHQDFPPHMHPQSEDCFFVLAGGGAVFDHARRFPLSAITGVWVPTAVPHGLATGPEGVIEIGVQAPPGPALDAPASGSYPQGIAVASVPMTGRGNAEWCPVFTGRKGWRYLDPYYCHLEQSQQVSAAASGYELLVAVVRGAVERRTEAGKNAVRVGAISVIHFRTGESALLRALESASLLLGIRVYS